MAVLDSNRRSGVRVAVKEVKAASVKVVQMLTESKSLMFSGHQIRYVVEKRRYEDVRGHQIR